jgi:hypothetical protein
MRQFAIECSHNSLLVSRIGGFYMASRNKRSHFLCLSAIVFLAGSAFAGNLDPPLGTGGTFTLAFPYSSQGYRSFGYQVFYQSSNRIVAAGTFTNMGPDGQATGVVLVD